MNSSYKTHLKGKQTQYRVLNARTMETFAVTHQRARIAAKSYGLPNRGAEQQRNLIFAGGGSFGCAKRIFRPVA